MKIEDVSRRIREKAVLLHEINLLLGNSLSIADSFRVVGREIFNVIPFKTGVLYSVQPESFIVGTLCSSGLNSDTFCLHKLDRRKISAFDIFTLEQAISIDLTKESSPFLPASLTGQYRSALIVPIGDRTMNFGLAVFYESFDRPYDINAVLHIEVLRPLISDLMIKARNSEKMRQIVAPTPVLETSKGFFTALQAHLDQCLWSVERGNLTVLHIEIRDFNQVLDSFGANSADILVSEVSNTIRNELRRLDIVSKISPNEILVSLPTVSALERASVTLRIKSAISRKTFRLPNNAELPAEIIVGSASLGFEGETAAELLYMASLDTRQQKVQINNSLHQNVSRINEARTADWD